ncbi:MAG: ATP synthase F1 subunit epsilon [bacterium]
MSKFHLHIVTPHGTYCDTDVDMLNVRTIAGQIGILANHIPLVSGIEISEMNYIIDGKRSTFAISGGVLYVEQGNKVTIIANAVESPEEIDLRRAEEAEKRAKRRLASKDGNYDIARAEIALKRALVRINVKNKY